MSDELPVTDGAVDPNPTQDQPESTDWQKRYTDTHANWNQLNEQLTRFKSDPNAVIEFIRETHPDLLTGDEDEDEDVDDFEPDEEDRPLTRAEFKAWQAEQQQTAAQQSAAQRYESDLEKFVNGRELSPLGERAIRGTPAKTPDELKAAVDEWFEYDAAKNSKPRPRVPHVPTNGTAATDVPNWEQMSRGDQARYMAEQIRASQA